MKNTKQSGSQIVAIGPSRDFESIKKLDENGVEYWTARELMGLLGYFEWRAFNEVVNQAIQAALNSHQNTENHFGHLTKMVRIGSGVERRIRDWKLDRYACYLVAQNGDSNKREIASAQTYFAVQTRKQEILEGLSASERRIAIRDGVVSENARLFATARTAGVSRFGAFDDAGYQGLYDMPLSKIEKLKRIKKGELMDRAGDVELAANIFRITQTEAKLKREGIAGDVQAQAAHFKVGSKIRQTMKELGSEMPEDLKPEKHVRRLKREVKAIGIGKSKQIGR